MGNDPLQPSAYSCLGATSTILLLVPRMDSTAPMVMATIAAGEYRRTRPGQRTIGGTDPDVYAKAKAATSSRTC